MYIQTFIDAIIVIYSLTFDLSFFQSNRLVEEHNEGWIQKGFIYFFFQ